MILLTRFFALLGLLFLTAGAAQARESTTLPTAENLQQAAAEAVGKGRALVVLYTREDCPYCETVRRLHLLPLLRTPAHRDQAIVQIYQDKTLPLRDFSGAQTTHKAFARQQKIRLVPVVAFYGPNGEELSPPLIGRGLADFYDTYLERGIAESGQRLSARRED